MAVENFGDGFIVADYTGKRGTFGAAYAGRDGVWHSHPMGMPPFPTKETAQLFEQEHVKDNDDPTPVDG